MKENNGLHKQNTERKMIALFTIDAMECQVVSRSKGRRKDI